MLIYYIGFDNDNCFILLSVHGFYQKCWFLNLSVKYRFSNSSQYVGKSKLTQMK